MLYFDCLIQARKGNLASPVIAHYAVIYINNDMFK